MALPQCGSRYDRQETIAALDGKDRRALQTTRVCLPIVGNLRRHQWLLGLRPAGAELKRNIKDAWWNDIVRGRTDVVGIDGTIITHPRVWEASGHVESFTDPMVDCKKCKGRWRADQLPDTKCPEGGPHEFTEARKFNLMFKTNVGPVEDTGSVAYLRPETAQAIFADFLNVLSVSRQKIPFGIGQIGKAFRNEINPRNFTFRSREFEQMELEFFIKPGTDAAMA